MFKYVLIVFILIETVNLTDISYYETLGISKQASTQEIRQAYKKLAIKFHPDKNPGAMEQEMFIKITEAYETLKDPDKRYKYDMYGSYPSYTRKYDYKSEAEYNNLYYNGLYHDDPFVDTLSTGNFYNYLQNGFHFINFYSPFCPPCQNLAEHWKKIAEVYKGIVKVGAVNCKHYNSFCYNYGIGSYPSLLFYPNGKNGNFRYYRGERTFEALDRFVMSYVESQSYVPTVSRIRSTDKPMAYVLGKNMIEKDALTRIAYHLNGLVTLVMVEEDDLRAQLSKNDFTTVVFKYKDITEEIQSTNEKEVLKEIVAMLPSIEMIEPEKLKKIRNQLRSGKGTPWVLYLSSKGHDRLLLHQMRISNVDMHFGEIDCDKWIELCLSLQAEEYPSWAVLKQGGVYQLLPPSADVKSYIHTAAAATRLHSLSTSDLATILNGDIGTWVLLVVPYKLPWDKFVDAFTKASLHYTDSDNINFGIMCCTANSDKQCRELAHNQPEIVVLTGGKRYTYDRSISSGSLVNFIELLKEVDDVQLNEQQVLEILDPAREHSWLVAFLPANCGRHCNDLMHQWRIVAKKLRALSFVRVGALQCSHADGFCANVRVPIARIYPYGSREHYTVNLQHLTEAAYILEWALNILVDSVHQLNWHSFSKSVAAEELNPSPGKKPWLVYFHSPRCHRCYEMYADFVITGVHLKNAVHIGKVNCISERNLCQHEQITSYPSLKLYLNRNVYHGVSTVINLNVRDHAIMLKEIKSHIRRYDESLLAGIDDLRVRSQRVNIKHDEF